MRRLPLLALILSTASATPAAAAQCYFGQPCPGTEAVPFSYAGIELGGLKPRNPVFSKDGTTVFFTAGEPSQIYWSRRTGGSWSAAERAPFADAGSNWEPFLTPDGTSVLFVSTRAPGAENRGRPFRAHRRADGSWSAAEPAFLLDDPAGIWFPNAPGDGRLYFSGELQGQLGKSDLYSVDAARPGVPERLAEPLSSVSIEWDPYVSPDGKLLVFVSDRPGGHGRTDIWVSARAAEGGWGAPVNAGPAINSAANDVAATFSPDGRHIFFVREPGNLFWISAEALARP
jgi:Tol biopolymer transport system component